MEIRLPSKSLSGNLPSALQYCYSTTTVVFSGNQLSGPIPSGLCDWIPNVVFLDLSGNNFNGSIPAGIVNCKFLNTLLLNGNKLSGIIPPELASLDRLRKFSVANNKLSGTIPSGLSQFGSSSFEGNNGLCGGSLGGCGGLSRTSLIIIIAAGVFGALVALLLAFAIWRWISVHPKGKKKKASGSSSVPSGVEGGMEDLGWVNRIRAHHLVQVTLFQKPIVKVKLADLMVATNDFQSSTVISTGGRTGKTYKATLSDGSTLAVKRLPGGEFSEKQFRSEMARLGQLRHPNLVPLLGFCVVEDERLLVFKHMASGSLSSLLHTSSAAGAEVLDWQTRLKIGIGASRGLAWLHHGIQSPIIHQNICSSVILLDEDHEARITDFGLKALMRRSSLGGAAFVDGEFGELGYVAPEYSSTMVASPKGDVFAFGVVLLELITGKKPLDSEEGFKGNLVDWVNYLAVNKRIGEAIDKRLLGNGNDDDIIKFMKVATSCVVSRPKERCLMNQVYNSLKEIAATAAGYDCSEHYDEFPLVYGIKDSIAGGSSNTEPTQ